MLVLQPSVVFTAERYYHYKEEGAWSMDNPKALQIGATLLVDRRQSFWKYFKSNIMLYILILPGLLYLIIFHYLPMFGVVIVFQDFSIVKGILGSPWVGFQNFTTLFHSRDFRNVLANSVIISFLKLLWGFPAPIILALLLNEVRSIRYKKVVQTIVYMPHFISWVVVASIMVNLLAPNGSLRMILTFLTGKEIDYLYSAEHFRMVLVLSDIWKEIGWGTVIYFATISGISQELYESAVVDGANRFRRMLHITLPGLRSTIVVLLILRMGSILVNGFEQIFLLYSPIVYNVSDVFETYVYRAGLLGGKFSYATTAGIFQSLVGYILILITNRAARKIDESSLW